MKLGFQYVLPIDAAMLVVRTGWRFDRAFVAQDVLFSRLSPPKTWLRKTGR